MMKKGRAKRLKGRARGAGEVCRESLQDRCLTEVPAETHQLLKEAFCRRNVTFGAQPGFDGIASGVDGAVEVFPLRADLHVGFAEAVRGAAHLEVRKHPPVDLVVS